MKRFAPLTLLMITICFGLVSGRTDAYAQENKKLAQEVIKVEDERYDAFMKGDAATLGRILDDGFTYTNTKGETHTKAELLAQVRAGDLKYIAMHHSDIRVIVFENTAVLTGKSSSTYVADGKAGGAIPRRFMNVYFKKNGHWKLVARQETPVPPKQ